MMNDKIKAISRISCVKFPRRECEICTHANDCPWVEDATAIYTAHIKPLEIALVSAAEREKMLAEALDDCLSIVEENNKFCMDSADESIEQARAALASVKRHV